MCPHFLRKLLILFGLLACGAVQASFTAFDGYAAASDEELDKMRGGFEIDFNGMQLMLAFSLEQLTYVNGELVASMRLNPVELIVANPASISAATAATAQLESMPSSAVASQIVNDQTVITLVQNGPGNAFTLPDSLNSLSTVIQNTANDQVIRNLTVLNATLSIQMEAAMARLNEAISQTTAAALR